MTEQETFDVARLGIRVHAWFNSPIGQYVLTRAQEQIEEIQTRLLEIDPRAAEAIRDLQDQAARARGAVMWLNDAIQDGEAAHHALQEQDQ